MEATVAATFDTTGDLLSVRGLLGAAQTTQYFYDADREVIGVVAPNPGETGLNYPATRYTYNDDGQLSEVETGTVVSQSQADWANFVSQQARTTAYDGVGRDVSPPHAIAKVVRVPHCAEDSEDSMGVAFIGRRKNRRCSRSSRWRDVLSCRNALRLHLLVQRELQGHHTCSHAGWAAN